MLLKWWEIRETEPPVIKIMTEAIFKATNKTKVLYIRSITLLEIKNKI